MTQPDPAIIDQPVATAPVRQSLFKTLVRNPMALAGLIIISMVSLIAIFADFVAPMSPITPVLDAINAPPGSPGHLLGADSSGRDILSRLIFGARLTLIGASIAIIVALAAGLPAGLIAGYFGGWFDAAASWVANVLLSLPNMIVLLAVIAAFGPSVYLTMAAFGIMLAPGIFRLVRAQVIAVKNELYVDAARVSGLSNTRIIGRHVLSVVRAPIIIQGSVLAGVAIIVQSGLEFLGLGDTSTVTWGGMLGEAFTVLYLSPTAIIWPGAIIAVTVASLVLVGNGLRDAVQGVTNEPRAIRTAGRQRDRARRAGSDADRPAGDHALEIRNLKVGYPQLDGSEKVVVQSVSLTIDRGQILGLVGESGSGKSQTAFSVLGLLPRGGIVLDGSIFVDGKDVLAMKKKERRSMLGTAIAYIPQEPMSNLDPAFTIGHQMVEPLRAAGMKRADATEKVLGLLARVGIPDPKRTFNSYPHQISGGMAQRVLIAGAISNDPQLLIADEPTTALDVTVQAEVLSLLRSLQKERNMAVMLVTHNFGVVADLCDTVAVMQHGKIVELAPVEELFEQPKDPYTQMLLASTLEDTEPRPPLGTGSPANQSKQTPAMTSERKVMP